MTRWIVFDQATAAAVASKAGGHAELCNAGAEQPGDVLAMAPADGTAIAVVPGEDSEHALLMRITRRAPQPARAEPRTSPPAQAVLPGARVAPGGFLGLADEVVLDDEEEPQPPKKWWQKILD